MTGDLPPSSSVTGTRFFEADCITFAPTFVEPVNRRWSKGSSANCWLISGPPVTTATSSSAKYLGIVSANRAAVSGTNSEGFSNARLPAASALVRGATVKPNGRFHGEIMPTTPFGKWRTWLFPPRKFIGLLVFLFSGFIHAFKCFIVWSMPSTFDANSENKLNS